MKMHRALNMHDRQDAASTTTSFVRILVAQAACHGLAIVTEDALSIGRYPVRPSRG